MNKKTEQNYKEAAQNLKQVEESWAKTEKIYEGIEKLQKTQAEVIRRREEYESGRQNDHEC